MKSRNVVSKYDIRLSFDENSANFSKFKVPELEPCASALRINVKTDDGKKRFNKLSLAKAIVSKIRTHLPHTCESCKEEYSVQLDDGYPFQCDTCQTPSHSCEEMKKMESFFPEGLPAGFVWLCALCTKGTASLSSDKIVDDDTAKVEDETSNTNVVEDRLAKQDSITIKNKSAKTDNKKLDQTKRKLCKFYLHKKCKYGINGNGCSFDHPKKCFKFVRDGTNKKGGCNKGKDCNYFHPPLCKSSLKGGYCDKSECRFFNIRGTKFRNPNEPMVNTDEAITLSKTSIPAQMINASSHPLQSSQERQYEFSTNSSGNKRHNPNQQNMAICANCPSNAERENQNFMELRQQMQFKMESMMKALQPQQAGACPCRTMCH